MVKVYDYIQIRGIVRTHVQILKRGLYDNKNIRKDVIFIVVLNGGFQYAFDFLEVFRNEVGITKHDTIAFMHTASYHTTGKSDPQIIHQTFGSNDLKDKIVVILDDIFDTGQTICKIVDSLRSFTSEAIIVSTLLSRAHQDKVLFTEESNDFLLITTPLPREHRESFLAGYGMNDNKDSRLLNYIYVCS